MGPDKPAERAFRIVIPTGASAESRDRQGSLARRTETGSTFPADARAVPDRGFCCVRDDNARPAAPPRSSSRPRRRSSARPRRSPRRSASSRVGCSVTSMATDFLSGVDALRPRRRRTRRRPSTSCRSAPCAALTMSPAATSRVDDEGEVAGDRLEVGQGQLRLDLGRLRLRRRHRVEHDLEGDRAGPSTSSAFRISRVNLAEGADHGLRAELAGVAERPGWNQSGPPAHDLQPGRRHAERRRAARSRRALASNASTAPAPPPSAGRRPRLAPVPRRTAAAAMRLVLRLVASEDLPDLEQRHVAEAAIGVALRRLDQARQQARAHVGQIRRDRVGERELRLSPPPNSSASSLAMNDQVTASTRPRAASARLASARARLDQRQDRLGDRVVDRAAAASARCGRRPRCASPPRPGRPCLRRPDARTAAATLTRSPVPATWKPRLSRITFDFVGAARRGRSRRLPPSRGSR